MGRSYQFECEKCGYRAAVAGGFTEGKDLKIRTIVCRDCRSVYDCVVQMRTVERSQLLAQFKTLPREVAPSLQSALARLPVSSSESRQWVTFDPACPIERTHRVEPWNSPGRCPKCRAYMEPGALPYRVWD